MARTLAALAALALCSVIGVRALAGDARQSALSWQKQANDTRATVAAVAEELGKADNPSQDAAGLIADATSWLARGDETLAAADAKMAAEDFESASSTYNMAWQYYVKAATAGLAAKTMLGGP
jgi:hypothetical protein